MSIKDNLRAFAMQQNVQSIKVRLEITTHSNCDRLQQTSKKYIVKAIALELKLK